MFIPFQSPSIMPVILVFREAAETLSQSLLRLGQQYLEMDQAD